MGLVHTVTCDFAQKLQLRTQRRVDTLPLGGTSVPFMSLILTLGIFLGEEGRSIVAQIAQKSRWRSRLSSDVLFYAIAYN